MDKTNGFRCKESATYQSEKLRVDADRGILFDAKILGLESKNQRVYGKDACNTALPLYEGSWINLNHSHRNTMAPGPRSVQDRFGRIRGVELRADGIYAKEVHFNPKHEFASTLIWWAENEPEALGFSHDAILHGPKLPDGRRSIESISRVFSVDIVADPGSTKSMFEEVMNDEPVDAGAAPAPSFEDSLAQVAAAIVADSSLDAAAKRKKLLALVKMLETGDEKPDEKTETKTDKVDDMTKPDDGKEQEIVSLKLELDAFRAKEQADLNRVTNVAAAKEACKKAGLKDKFIDQDFIDGLVELGQESWDKQITSRKRILTGNSFSATPDATAPKDVAGFVSRILGSK